MDNEINLFEVLLAKKLAGSGGGSQDGTVIKIDMELESQYKEFEYEMTYEVNP